MGFAQVANLITNPRELARFFGFAPIFIGDIIVDVLRSETPVYEYEITEHPVEAGLDVTDNRIKRPTGLIMDCILSDTVLDPASIAAAVTAGVLAKGVPPLTWQSKWQAMKELAEKNQVVAIYTPLDTYQSMMLKSLRLTQDKDTANAAFVTVEFREIRTVFSEINPLDSATQLPVNVQQQEKPENTESAKKTSKKNLKGSKGTSDTSSKNSSTLFDTFG